MKLNFCISYSENPNNQAMTNEEKSILHVEGEKSQEIKENIQKKSVEVDR